MMDEKQIAQMQENMKRMQQQIDRIRQAKDPKEHQKLLQEHMRTMQENMQMMRGMGGMMMGMMGGPSGKMGPGMSATAEITTKTENNVIAVPLQAIVEKKPEGSPSPTTSPPSRTRRTPKPWATPMR